MTTPSPKLRAHVAELVRQHGSPTQAQVHRRSLAVISLGAAWWIAGTLLLGADLESRPSGWLLMMLAVWTVTGVLGTYVALSSGGSSLGRPRPLLMGLSWAIVSLLLAVSILAGVLWPETQSAPAGPWLSHAGCFVFTFVLAAGPLAGLLLSQARTDPVRPTATGALLGAVAGAWGGVGMSLHCARTETVHLVIGHVLPVAGVAIVGALLGAAVLALNAPKKARNT